MKAYKAAQTIATFPTTAAQQRIWTIEQLQPGFAGLNIAMRWDLHGRLPSDVIESALKAIIGRHEILRTRFLYDGGELIQEIVGAVDFRLARVDLRNIAESSQELRIREIALDFAREPFDLSIPCQLRVALIQTSQDRASVLATAHRLVMDGFSTGILGHEMATIAAATLDGIPHGLPDLPLQFGHYAKRLRDCESSEAHFGENAFWMRYLDGMSYSKISPARPRKPKKPQSKTFERDLPADFELRMAAAAKAMGVSMFNIGAAAMGAALERFCGRQDVSFAIQVAGRDEVDLEPLIGVFANPLFLHFDVKPDATLADHIAYASGIIVSALAKKGLAFDKQKQHITPARPPLRSPLLSVMFNFQRAFLKERSYGSFGLCSMPSLSPGTPYDLNISILGRNSGWRLVIDYDANWFDGATVENLSELLLRMLDFAIDAPQTHIAAIAPINRKAAALRRPITLAPAPKDSTLLRTAEHITTIWTKLLTKPQCELDSDFFELGGDPMMALRMLTELDEKFGVRPSLSEFVAAPTVTGLAKLIDEKKVRAANLASVVAADAVPSSRQCTKDWNLVELRRGSGYPVLVTVNQIRLFESMARKFAVDCPIANISVRDSAALARISRIGFDAALEEAAIMIAEQYGGRPLVLAGLGVDGRAALRIAQALRAHGSNVALVAMIDTWSPGATLAFSRFQLWRNKWAARLRRLIYIVGLLRNGKIGATDLVQQYSFTANLLRLLGRPRSYKDLEALIDATVGTFVAQTRAYRFAPYSGETVLFVTESQGLVPDDGVLGWSATLPEDTATFLVRGWHGDALASSGSERIVRVLDVKLKRVNSPSP